MQFDTFFPLLSLHWKHHLNSFDSYNLIWGVSGPKHDDSVTQLTVKIVFEEGDNEFRAIAFRFVSRISSSKVGFWCLLAWFASCIHTGMHISQTGWLTPLSDFASFKHLDWYLFAQNTQREVGSWRAGDAIKMSCEINSKHTFFPSPTFYSVSIFPDEVHQ